MIIPPVSDQVVGAAGGKSRTKRFSYRRDETAETFLSPSSNICFGLALAGNSSCATDGSILAASSADKSKRNVEQEVGGERIRFSIRSGASATDDKSSPLLEGTSIFNVLRTPFTELEDTDRPDKVYVRSILLRWSQNERIRKMLTGCRSARVSLAPGQFNKNDKNSAIGSWPLNLCLPNISWELWSNPRRNSSPVLLRILSKEIGKETARFQIFQKERHLARDSLSEGFVIKRGTFCWRKLNFGRTFFESFPIAPWMYRVLDVLRSPQPRSK